MTKVRCTVEVGNDEHVEVGESANSSTAVAKNSALMKAGKYIPDNGTATVTCEEV